MECGSLVLREELKLKKVTWGLIFFSKGAGRNGGGEVDRQLLVAHKIQLLNFIWVLCSLFSIFFISFFQFLRTLHTSLHELDYPNIAVLIVIAISPGTGPVKRS